MTVRKQIVLTYFEEVEQFASYLGELVRGGVTLDKYGRCKGSKILQRSGEVAVLIPTLKITWSRPPNGSKVAVCFTWAVLNAESKLSYKFL